jgi:hypothetical protein
VRTEPGIKKEEKEEFYRANEAAALYFNNLLLNAPAAEKARSYIAKRGFSSKTVADFQLGFSLDVSGDLMIVGSHLEDIDGDLGNSTFEHGAAYIFIFDTDNWDFKERITATDAEHMADFGVSVGISGNYAIVGSPLKTVGTVTEAGSAYAFQRSAANEWHTITPAVLTLSSPGAGDWYGWSAAISGDTAMVGAFNRDQLATNDGAAFVYARATANNGYFGMAISLDETRAAVGATTPYAVAQGAVYVLN